MKEVMNPQGRNGVTALRRGKIEIVPFDSPPVEDTEERIEGYLQLHRALSSWSEG